MPHNKALHSDSNSAALHCRRRAWSLCGRGKLARSRGVDNFLFMAMIEGIRGKFERRQYEFCKHAVDQSITRDISVAEVEDAMMGQSEIIEDYPDDKYGPSCLVFGYTRARRPLHVQCSYPSRPLVKIITLYKPDPDLWIDCRIRR